jgi:DNA-binding MltR family transcriptional regulator
MSNRDALRRLSRKFPAPPEIEKILDDLRTQNDMSVAIVSSAIVEAALEKLITSKFKSKSASLAGRIFLNRGPLSDFDSKILVAQAFGILTANLAEELHCIRVIRNTFAHSKVPVTFDHELLDREMKSLRMPRAMRAVGGIKNVENVDEIKLELSNKQWFLLITRIILIMMDEISKHPGSANEALVEALKEDIEKTREP